MSGRITKTIIDLAEFSFLFDRVRCGLVRPFLVQNWCGGMGTSNRRSVHLSTPGGPSPHSTLSVKPIFSRANSSRTTSKQAKCIEGHGPLFGRPIADDVQ